MRRYWPLIGVCLLLAGCHSAPTQFYTLTSSAGASRVPFGFARAQPVVVGRVELPGDLDRDSFVTRVGPNRLNVSDTDRWAGPFDEMIQRVLASDLSSRLPAGMVLAPGDPIPASGARTVKLTIRQFMGDANGHVVLEADWSLLAGNPPKPELIRHEQLFDNAASNHPSAIVATMGHLLARLADRIADTIAASR
jgi:uncharacterized lipoprotein YmbA